MKLKLFKIAIFLAALVPLARLAYRGYAGLLGANPIEVITRATGDWTLRLLLLTLLITPLRRLSGWHSLIRFRRMLGLFAFFYGFLHLMTFVWLDKFFDVHDMLKDIAKRPFITMGMTAFALLVPLAVTSTQGMIRRLGKRWQTLHRLIYFSALAGVIHFWWLVKKDVRQPEIYAALLALLLGARLVLWARKARALPRVAPVSGSPARAGVARDGVQSSPATQDVAAD